MDLSDDVQVVLEEYRLIWAYYQRTFDERRELFNWYFKIVALPVGVLGSIAAGFLFADDAVSRSESRAAEFSDALQAGGAFLLLACLAGLTLYATYVRQCGNAGAYLQEIRMIRGYLRSRFTALEPLIHVAPLDRHSRDSRFGLGSVRFMRGLSLAVTNSSIGSAGIMLFTSREALAGSVGFVLIFLLHLGLYYRLAWKEFPVEEIDDERAGAA